MEYSRYMRLRRRAVVDLGDLCDRPGCTEPASWWGGTIPDGRVLMCDAHKSNYANEVLEPKEN